MDKVNKSIKPLVIPKQCTVQVLNAHHDQNGHIDIARYTKHCDRKSIGMACIAMCINTQHRA